jgi:3-oxoacyl-[acyl-carrier-protein] synthase-3
LRVCRNLLLAEPHLRTVLAVAASRESYLLDYGNERSRFMFGFGDGAVAVLLVRDHPANELLASSMVTDGTLSLQVKVPAGGSVAPASAETVARNLHFLDVANTTSMKERLDDVSLDNFLRAAERAAERSQASLSDVSYLCAIHMKRSMHERLATAVGVDPARAPYLDDTGHMSGVDPLLALDRAARAGELADGDVVLLLAAGTGYTWAASLLRWGNHR